MVPRLLPALASLLLMVHAVPSASAEVLPLATVEASVTEQERHIGSNVWQYTYSAGGSHGAMPGSTVIGTLTLNSANGSELQNTCEGSGFCATQISGYTFPVRTCHVATAETWAPLHTPPEPATARAGCL